MDHGLLIPFFLNYVQTFRRIKSIIFKAMTKVSLLTDCNWMVLRAMEF